MSPSGPPTIDADHALLGQLEARLAKREQVHLLEVADRGGRLL